MQTKTDEHPLPEGWQLIQLGKICQPIRGVTFQSGEAKALPFEDSIACITTSGVQDKIDWESRCYIPKSRLSSEQQVLRLGDIVVSTANSKALVGKSCVVSHLPFPCTFGAFVTVLRLTNSDVDSTYLSHWFRSPDVLAFFFEVSANTTNISNLKVTDILAIEIPLPPLDEQRRIASRLNEQLTIVESALKAAEEQLQAAYKLSSLYLREVFDNHTANNWAKVRLGEILNPRKEIIHPYDNPKGPAIFVGLEHIESNTGVRIGSVDVEMSKLTGRKPKFYKGDIVYGYLRPYLNKVWIAEFDGLCSVDQYIYKVDNNKADTSFVAWFMRCPVYLERAPIDTSPGQLPRIRTEEVASVEINLPPLDEQRKTSLQITEKLNDTNNLINALESQLAEIESLPASLLREAFAGQG